MTWFKRRTGKKKCKIQCSLGDGFFLRINGSIEELLNICSLKKINGTDLAYQLGLFLSPRQRGTGYFGGNKLEIDVFRKQGDSGLRGARKRLFFLHAVISKGQKY